jgi:hypothetical protein
MKKICVLIFALILSNIAVAQKFVPKVGVGTVLNYNIIATSSGQQIPLVLSVISINDPMKLKWDLPGIGTGSFLIPSKAIESGTKMRLEEPSPNVDTKFKDNETIMFISKSSFAELVKDQTFTINKIKFTVKASDTPVQINGKDADVLHAVNAKGDVEIWILNNPDFPVICKLTGNPGGIDFDLRTVKE